MVERLSFRLSSKKSPGSLPPAAPSTGKVKADTVILVTAMRENVGMDKQLHSFLNLALDGGQ